MESARLTAHVADVALYSVPAEATSTPPLGRFSTGIEQLPDGPGKRRVGRFCDGIAQAPETSHELPVGRFSTGIERAATPSSRRVGSFADGYGALGRR